MDRFYVITNHEKDKDRSVTTKIKKYLEQKEKVFMVQGEEHIQTSTKYRFTDPSLIPEDVDCLVVLGGDGTLIQAARDTVDKQLPILGINMGTLGYLAEIEECNIFPALDKLIKNEYAIGRRMMLDGVVSRDGDILEDNIALNDIVINRKNAIGVIRFDIYVSGQYLNSFTADGLIISTPTGSTGYNLSAGGPIVSPKAAMILITPICPHTLNTRSIILSPDDEVEIHIGERAGKKTGEAVVTFDGDVIVPLVVKDRIAIKRSEKYADIVKLSDDSFLETLRKKIGDN